MSYSYDKIIIDGNNFLFRAFFVKRPEKYLHGMNVSPIHQFLYMLKSAVNNFKAKEVILTWDRKLNATKRNFRKDMVAYKEQRVETDATNNLFNTIDYIQEFIDALGIKTIRPVNMEADDVIRYLSNTKDKTIIVSSDQDLLQLVSDNVHLYLPSKDVVITLDNFEQFTNNKDPKIFVVYKSILGDKSDNINGLEKYGKVKAKSLAEKIYKDGVIDFSESNLTPEQINIVNRNLTVMDLSKTEEIYPEEYSFYKEQEDNFSQKFNAENLKDLFRKYEFFPFLNNFWEWNTLFNKNRTSDDLLSVIRM
jgi:DNA polymerase-1